MSEEFQEEDIHGDEIQEDDLRRFIGSISLEYEFEEVQTVTETQNKSEEVRITTIRKGIFKSSDNIAGIFCKFADWKALKPPLYRALSNKLKVEHIYYGDRFLLCLTDRKIYSYDIERYQTMNEIIKSIDYELPLKQREVFIGFDEETKFDICIIETDIALFAIAGLHGAGQEEEERVILSNKLEQSQPFFKFKAPIHFEWSNLIGDKDRQFERICELLLQKEKNVVRVIPIGKTRSGDRGRDFEVVERGEGFNNKDEEKWLVQCKYSDHSIAPSTISGWTDRVIEHKYAGYWLMTNNDITPSLFDQLKDVEKNKDYNIQVRFWQRSDFHIKLNVYSELFTKGDIFQNT
jgi:hypothetical protein